MATTLSPSSNKKLKMDTSGTGNYVMAELEKRLKRRAVSDSRLKSCHGDIVAPEYQQQAGLLNEDPSSESLSVVSERFEEAKEKSPSRGHYKYVSTPIGNRGIERKAKNRFTTDGTQHTGPLSPPKPFSKNSYKTEQQTKVPLKVPAQLANSSKQPIVKISFNQQLLCPIAEPGVTKEGAGVKELARAFSSLSKQNRSPPDSKNVSPSSGRKPFSERNDTCMDKEVCIDSSGGVSEASILEDSESVTREDKHIVNRTPDDQQPNNCSGYTTTASTVEMIGRAGTSPKSMYMNVFDDDATTKPGSPKAPLSPNNPKKPIPTPRRTSESTGKFQSESRKKSTGATAPSGDTLHHVVTLSSHGETSDQSDPEESEHTPLARSTSSGSNNVICRRTTPKAQKELRKGVVTVGDLSNPSSSSSAEVDEYITMNPTQRQKIILSITNKRNRAQTELPPPLSLTTDSSLRIRSESTASTQSAYYLKVLPGAPNTPPQCTPSPPPTQSAPSIPDRPQLSSSREPTRSEDYIPMTSPLKQSSDSASKSPLSAKRSIAPNLPDVCPRNRSQGSVFAREMLSYAEDRVKHSVPGTGRRVSPAQNDAGPMYIEWHEYVDIDPAEIARQRAALSPPRVPPRPDVFPVSSRGTTTNKSYKTVVTFVPTSQDSLPPPPPPKSDSLLREQRALPPLPPLPPLVKGRSQTTLSSSPPKPSRAKEIIRALKREAFNRTPRKGRSSGSSPLYPPPRLHSRDQGVSRLERSFSDPSLLEPTATESSESLTTANSTTGDKSSYSSNDISNTFSSDDERARSSTVLIYEEPLDRPRMRERSGAVRNKINRDSVALILKHRDVIAQRLSTQGRESMTQSHEDDEKRGKETLIRSLGSILLEIDGLLRTGSAYTEEDLVSAIERELKVNLRGPAPQQDSQPSEPPPELTEQDVDDVIAAFAEEDEEEEVGSPIRPRKSRLRRSLSDAILLEHSSAVRHNRRAPGGEPAGIELDTDEEEEDLDTEEEEEETVFTQSLEPQRNHRLQRVNAKRRPSATADDIIARFNSITNGEGYVTHTGARLQNTDTQVIVDVPKGALSRGKRHRLWFDVMQNVYRYQDEEKKEDEEEEDSYYASPEQRKMESLLRGKAEGTIQLSPLVVVGPGDISLHKPIKITLPHCVPSSNQSWILKVQGRAQNSEADEWVTLTRSFTGSVPKSHKKSTYFRGATYQLHRDCVVIRTKQLGSFRLIGRPVSKKGRNVSKKMTCMIYSNASSENRDQPQRVKVVFVNAIQDHIEAVNKELCSSGWMCLEQYVPLVCRGDHGDMQVTLLSGSRPLDTKIIPFGLIWRIRRIGQAAAVFNLFTTLSSPVSAGGRQFVLRLQQSTTQLTRDVKITIP